MSTTAEGAAPASARSRKGARTRARLVEAAKEVFEEHGLLDARISDITTRAGLSYGSFYNYFESKEALFREVADTIDDRLSQPMNEIVFARQSAVTPQDRLAKAIRLHFENYRDQARLMGVIEQAARFDVEVRDARRARSDERGAQVAESIRLLQRRGLADPHLDADIAAAALGAMTYRFAELWLAQGQVECDFDEGVETVTRLFVNALGISSRSGDADPAPA